MCYSWESGSAPWDSRSRSSDHELPGLLSWGSDHELPGLLSWGSDLAPGLSFLSWDSTSEGVNTCSRNFSDDENSRY